MNKPTFTVMILHQGSFFVFIALGVVLVSMVKRWLVSPVGPIAHCLFCLVLGFVIIFFASACTFLSGKVLTIVEEAIHGNRKL